MKIVSKTLLAVGMMVLSSPVFANNCKSLHGDYLCKTAIENVTVPFPVQISFREPNTVDVDLMGQMETFVLDGKLRDSQYDDSRERGVCLKKDGLETMRLEKFFDDRKVAGITFVQDKAGDLQLTMLDGDDQLTAACQKKTSN